MTDNARISVRIVSSQVKLFPDMAPEAYEELQAAHCTLLSEDAFSLQLAMRTPDAAFHPVSVAVKPFMNYIK